jgi:hypothetical protein
LDKKYTWTIIILAVALMTASYYTLRFPPSNEPLPSTFLTTPSLAPRITFEQELPPSSSNQPEPSTHSESGSQIRINPSPSGGSSQQSNSPPLGVYNNEPSGSQFETMSAIDWSADGPILPGQSRNSSAVYFRNEGDAPVTLSFSSSAWSFKDYTGKSLSQDYRQYFSLAWDYDNSTLQVGEVKAVVFTLSVAPGIVDVATFSFDLMVTLAY